MNTVIRICLLFLLCLGFVSCKTTDYAMYQQYLTATQTGRYAEPPAPPKAASNGDAIKVILIVLLFLILIRQMQLSGDLQKIKKELFKQRTLRIEKSIKKFLAPPKKQKKSKK